MYNASSIDLKIVKISSDFLDSRNIWSGLYPLFLCFCFICVWVGVFCFLISSFWYCHSLNWFCLWLKLIWNYYWFRCFQIFRIECNFFKRKYECVCSMLMILVGLELLVCSCVFVLRHFFVILLNSKNQDVSCRFFEAPCSYSIVKIR